MQYSPTQSCELPYPGAPRDRREIIARQVQIDEHFYIPAQKHELPPQIPTPPIAEKSKMIMWAFVQRIKRESRSLYQL